VVVVQIVAHIQLEAAPAVVIAEKMDLPITEITGATAAHKTQLEQVTAVTAAK
jgi:hypothetical protein